MKKRIYDKLINYITYNQNKFYRLAYSYVKNQEDALDVVGNAVCKALEKYESIKNEDAIKTWFYRILVNESLQVLNNRKKRGLVSDERILEIQSDEKGFEVYDDLYGQIELLEKDVQSIIKLRYFEELSLDEISEIMSMNLSTVKSKLYRALETLKIGVLKEAKL